MPQRRNQLDFFSQCSICSSLLISDCQTSPPRLGHRLIRADSARLLALLIENCEFKILVCSCISKPNWSTAKLDIDAIDLTHSRPGQERSGETVALELPQKMHFKNYIWERTIELLRTSQQISLKSFHISLISWVKSLQGFRLILITD